MEFLSQENPPATVIDGPVIVTLGQKSPDRGTAGEMNELHEPGISILYRIQIASFQDASRADVLKREVQSRFDIPVFIQFNDATQTYRVRAGEFHSRPEAESFGERLQEAGYAMGWVVSDEEPGEPVLTGAESRSRSQTTVPASTLRVENGQHIEIGSQSLPARPSTATPVLRISPLHPSDHVAFDNLHYRGAIELVQNVRGSLNVVNVVDLEGYLKGVIPNEMPPSKFDALEALKAQAVAARTYALKNENRFLREGYQLCPTNACQIYRGVDSEGTLSSQAVDETNGIVIEYKGELIDSLYTSTCGGRTEDARNMFRSMDAPYLRSVACPPEEATTIDPRLVEVSGYHLKWNVHVTREAMEQTIRKVLPLDRLMDLEPLERGPSGRVIELKVVGRKRDYTLRGLEVKSVLGLKDSLFTLKRMRDRRGDVVAFDFSGRGWGHGVGLCQTGAYGLARQGMDYISILKTYYTGVEVVRENPREN